MIAISACFRDGCLRSPPWLRVTRKQGVTIQEAQGSPKTTHSHSAMAESSWAIMGTFMKCSRSEMTWEASAVE